MNDIDVSYTRDEDSHIINIIKKYKIILLLPLIVLILILILLIPKKEKVELYIELEGSDMVTLYVGEEYKEPGFIVYDSKKHKYDKEVKIEINLDINTPGEYTITYKLQGKEKKRTIIVLEKVSYKIELESIDNEETIYLRINDEYIEPGYKVIDNNGNDVTASFDVSVTGDVDTSNPGTYKIVYEIIDSNNEVITVEREVIVIDNKLELGVDKIDYTNTNILVNLEVVDEYFDYLLLPNGEKIEDKEYTYSIEENGIYKFVLYNKKGFNIEKEIEINNIDKEKPSGTCTGVIQDGKTIININGNDNVKVKEYILGKNKYTANKITLNEEKKNINIEMYDIAGNKNNIICDVSNKNINMTISPNTTAYTNGNVVLTISVDAEDFDYILLSDSSKLYKKNTTYTARENGTYVFTVYNKDGYSKTSSIKVNNIDKVVPSGSCSGSYKSGVSNIKISASDNVGISKYVINGVSYTSSNITINKEIDNLSVLIYDKANNVKTITCKLKDMNPTAKDDPIYLTEKYHDNSINGIRYILYNQADSRWGSVKYPSGATIKSSGCMLTSAAVISSSHDVNITPKKVFDNRRKLWVSDDINYMAGDSFTCKLVRVSDASNVSTTYINKIYEALEKGYPVVIRVHGKNHSNPGTSKFTSSQHYMALIDYKDGKIFVGNSYSSSGYGKSGWYDKDVVLTSVREVNICTPNQAIIDKYK